MDQQAQSVLLAELRDIIVPPIEAPTMWPNLLLILTLIISAYTLLSWLRQKRFPWRKEVLSTITELKKATPAQRSLPLHKLLRQLAISENPNSSGLTGSDWNLQLNSILRTQYFSAGSGAEFLNNLYSQKSPSVDDSVIHSLQKIIETRTRWPW